jgi:beta-carotene hydroxylase
MGDAHAPAPRLVELVPDALAVSRRRILLAVARPWLALAIVLVAAAHGWWAVAVLAAVAVFVTDIPLAHDLFHANLGLGRRANGALLTVHGMLILNSGHAIAVTHREHHRRFPGPDDPEAYLDGRPVWRVLAEGPVYRFHIWRWAWQNGREVRTWVALEASLWVVMWVVAVALREVLPGLLLFVVLGELANWAFPILSVTGVHDGHAEGHLRQTRTTHARFARLLLGMQLHLEHHLYPRVPSHRLPEVARALDPWLTDNDAAVHGGSG